MDSLDVSALVPKLGPPLYRFFLARMPHSLADEAVQEVFLRLLLPNSFDQTKGNIENYIWGVAANVQREVLRKQGLVQEYNEEEKAENDRFDDAFRDLRRAINKLSEPECQVFQMVLADLSIDQIAEHLNMPTGTVKSYIHRGKEDLKKIMKRWGYE